MKKILMFLLVVLIFVALGPAVGTLAVFVGSVLPEIIKSSNIGIGVFQGLSFVMFIGYVFGWAFALAAGVFVAAAGIWFGWNNFLAPVAGALFSTLAGGLSAPLIFQLQPDVSSLVWFLPACLLATFVCWYLTRGIVRRTWQSV